MTGLILPTTNGNLETYSLSGTPIVPERGEKNWNRTAYAAAHVVADPLANNDPWMDSAIDWDTTIAFREHLWSLGFGVAEAMDTAQRGMGLDWSASLELIQRSVAASKLHPGALIASGVGTDQLAPSADLSIDDIIAAYEQQFEAVEGAGSKVIMMASRALCAAAKGPDDYAKVYSHLLSNAKEPVVLHWLGEMFDPALEGYWGSNDHMAAMDTCLNIIKDNADNIDGIKISLLSAEKEIAMRERLPDGVLMYTGDDFNYPELIEGDDKGYSHALLGIFDAIAPAAASALSALASGDNARYNEIFAPTVPLSRHIFKTPTRFYKTGVVFLAYLNGFQDHFTMIGGQQSTRSAVHLAEIFRLADKAGCLINPDMAMERTRAVMRTHGIEEG